MFCDTVHNSEDDLQSHLCNGRAVVITCVTGFTLLMESGSCELLKLLILFT